MIYFISDTHFGHRRILQYSRQIFDNIEQMDQAILNEINAVVGVNDVLYILGDFCIYNKEPIYYRSLIQCSKVHIVLGNHDLCRKGKIRNFDGFTTVNHVNQIIAYNKKIYLSHYPHRSWPSSHKGSYHLYGHVHGKLDHEDRSSTRRTLDVGVDNTSNYGKPLGQPWSFKEIQKILDERANNGRI